jgi:hypothetical protein
MTLSAFGGEDLTVSRHLIRRGNLRFLEKDILVSNADGVPASSRSTVVAIEESFAANIG